jgi:isoquinoline 1-oxidoreductase alpha subunit
MFGYGSHSDRCQQYPPAQPAQSPMLYPLIDQESFMAYKLNVNGQSSTVDVPPDMPLLWVLRDVLNLRGTKYGCGIGQCAACTVQLNGKAARACQTPVSTVGSQAVMTIEGLSVDGTHPVQLAWSEIDVPQCGYCQAGQMMAAAALLAKKPNPNDSDIDSAMNGNLCRCGTYLRIRKAIHKAAELATSASAKSRQQAQLEPTAR